MIDYETPVGELRVLIPDTELLVNSNSPLSDPEHLFSDAQLYAFLRIARGSVLRAAGMACDAIGGSEALISKVITTDDLSTDGAKLGNYWLNRAKEFYRRADNEEEADADGFVLIPFHVVPEHTEPR
jgi:hypothetical protein